MTLSYRAATMSPPGPDHERFADLTFEDFRNMAADDSLSRYEKIGFPDEYREGSEARIFDDILAKLPAIGDRGRTVLDIGPGCSDLPRMIDEHCVEHDHTLLLVDSDEMLRHQADRPGLEKFAAQFPDCPELLERFEGQVDAILAYSVLHYVFPEASVFDFVDRAASLLAPGGSLLIGDIPNASRRKRLFASDTGRRLHREYTGRDEDPSPVFNVLEPGKIDDAVVLAILSRARGAGFDAYVVPQPDDLPMANRREDVVIRRP
jgi:Methyltransferase domain